MKKNIIILSSILTIFLGIFLTYKYGNNSKQIIEDAVVDSVTPYDNKYAPSIINLIPAINENDYETVLYYSEDIIVGKISKVLGVEVKGDDTLYNEETLVDKYSEFEENDLSRNKEPVDIDAKQEHPEETEIIEDDIVGILDVESVWQLEIEEVIKSENNLNEGQIIEIVSAGFPNTLINDKILYRDNDIFIFALTYNRGRGYYIPKPINQEYVVKNSRMRSAVPLENVKAYEKFVEIKDIPKNVLNYTEMYGSETQPDSIK